MIGNTLSESIIKIMGLGMEINDFIVLTKDLLLLLKIIQEGRNRDLLHQNDLTYRIKIYSTYHKKIITFELIILLSEGRDLKSYGICAEQG